MNANAADLENAVAVDCEMVGLESGRSCLARVCIVSWHEEILLDSYVAASGAVADYRTRYSGIREKDLRNAPPFAEVQAKVAAIVSERIFIAHGASGDLAALQLQHPANLIIDTVSLDWGPGRAVNLKALSLEVLGQPIQHGVHSPVEDALACLRLLKAFRGSPAGPPPSRVVQFSICSLERPSPPGAEADESPVLCADGYPIWTVTFPWSSAAVRGLLEWYADGGPGDDQSAAGAAPLCFPPSLVKDHREQLHKEARRLRLLTHSSGIGDARAIRVLPRGASVPEPTAHVRRLAGMVYDWLRDEAEQAGEEASGPPFSRGEVVELVELADREHANGSAPLPAAIASLIRRAHAVAATAPSPGEGGEQLAVRVRSDYERALVVRGCSEAVVSERSPTSRSAPGDRHRHSRGGSARGRRK